MKKPGFGLMVSSMMIAMLSVGVHSQFRSPFKHTSCPCAARLPWGTGATESHRPDFVSSPPNVTTGQSSAAMWGAALAPMTTIPTLVFEYTRTQPIRNLDMVR